MNNRCLGLLMGCYMAFALVLTAQADNPILASHLPDLVILQENQLVPLKADQILKAPYTILYFSAGWCPDCRRFSPVLVKAYDAQPSNSRKFEVLLIPMDKTEADMVKYMRQEKMKWPALAFARNSDADLMKYYSGEGIPCLTVIDSEGNIILRSKSDQDAAGILTQLQALIVDSQKPPQGKENTRGAP